MIEHRVTIRRFVAYAAALTTRAGVRAVRRPSATARLKNKTVALAWLAMCFSCLPTPAWPQAGEEKDADALREASSGFQRESVVAIQPGELSEAEEYYGRIGGLLNFKFETSSLDSFLTYLGYNKAIEQGGAVRLSGLLAKDLERIDSFDLMPRNAAEFEKLADAVSDGAGFRDVLSPSDFTDGKVLVSRFFAPKIATYFDPDDEFVPVAPGEIEAGWRKLVRLRPRPGSGAANADVKQVYLLFNFKEVDPDADPFPPDKESGNNQVIIVPKDQDADDSIYFAVYKAQSDEYDIGFFLAADFDLPGHVGAGSPDGEYFVPRSCAECHGHSGGGLKGRPVDAAGIPVDDFGTGHYRFAKPNYLDTDQWYDWMEFDYPGVTASLNDVVFDGTKDHGSAAYDRAFEVIRKINVDVKDETFAAERVPGVKTYQTLAAEKWVELHSSDNQRKPYSVRSIGDQSWDQTSAQEMRLLRLLNNHCFRCHSSLRYNVFDRRAVEVRRSRIERFLERPVFGPDGDPLPGFFMPQGRVLTASEREEMIRLLGEVFDSP